MDNMFKNLIDKFNKRNFNKNFTSIVILLLIGILLLIFSSIFDRNNENIQTVNLNNENNMVKEKTITLETNDKNLENKIEDKLKSILEDIEGVGKVKVMIYFDGGEEQVPAFNINDSTSQTEETDNEGGKRKITQNNDGRTVVMTNDGNNTKPLIVKKYKPKITGVCIVAQGADNKIVRLWIQKAVVDLFNLQPDKVNVYPMKS